MIKIRVFEHVPMNIRNTKQRQAIFEAIEHHGGHLTADEIYKLVKRRFPRLSLGTVYRNLRVLVAQAALRELDFGMAVTYFETVKDPHYHLICRVCGSITDTETPLESRLKAIVGQARGVGGFRIEGHRLDFVGVCVDCQSNPRKTNKGARPIKSR